jgi:hypothetical protein
VRVTYLSSGIPPLRPVPDNVLSKPDTELTFSDNDVHSGRSGRIVLHYYDEYLSGNIRENSVDAMSFRRRQREIFLHLLIVTIAAIIAGALISKSLNAFSGSAFGGQNK